MLSTAVLLAASMVVGQAETNAPETPDFNPNLAPMAWIIGEWECPRTSATGELRTIRRVSCKWVARNQVLLIEISETKPDGTPAWDAVVNYYWDPASKRISARLFAGRTLEEQVLLSTDNNEMNFESRMVFPDGNQGLYKCKVVHTQDSYTMAWAKISGTGSADIGPMVHTRLK